jgi:hypothetical protein
MNPISLTAEYGYFYFSFTYYFGKAYFRLAESNMDC